MFKSKIIENQAILLVSDTLAVRGKAKSFTKDKVSFYRYFNTI